MTTYTITTKPRENGNKLAITVEARDESGKLIERLTKVTGRTHPYVVVEINHTTHRWVAKTREMERGSFLNVNVVKGTANYLVADKSFEEARRSFREGDAAVVLHRPSHVVRNGSIYAPAIYTVTRSSALVATTTGA